MTGKVTLHSVLSLTLTNIIIMIFRLLESGITDVWNLVSLFLVFFVVWIIYIIGERLLKRYLNIDLPETIVNLQNRIEELTNTVTGIQEPT